MPPNGTGLTITNPLVLYRSLLATNRITPDPAQHRLALHLQKLYENLIDYEPTIEYAQRLQQLSRAVGPKDAPAQPEPLPLGRRGIWTSLLEQKEKRDSLALTRVLTSHEAAMNLQSPKGLMLHGEVGTGKSMLIDLFADCLPNRKKRRWHFNTFMLDTISRLEALRKSRSAAGGLQDEYSLLWLARDLIEKSPILFLDEFQLPDRAASKILSNLMTSFFQLGGVLIATSNRMPEELAKAAGMEFARPVSRFSRLGWSLGLRGVSGRDDGPGQKGEFAQFLEVLRARCEVWEMEGKKDYRRLSGSEDGLTTSSTTPISPSTLSTPSATTTPTSISSSTPPTTEPTPLPKHYLITPTPTCSPQIHEHFTTALSTLLHTATSILPSSPIPWTPHTLTIYARPLTVPTQYRSVALFPFSALCGSNLGPADYITLASTYHTIIITSIPILSFLQKNEARRFITLLDAMYEARCRLGITAAAPIDSLLFPEPSISNSRTNDVTSNNDGKEISGAQTHDPTYSETYSEIHQDLTSPFRPNISSYNSSSSSTTELADDALEDDPPNRFRRSGSSFTDERRATGGRGREINKNVDFANLSGLTGEDERFAVARARSRIWEMCSARWWARGESQVQEQDQDQDQDRDDAKQLNAQRHDMRDISHPSWWRPLAKESRHWERDASETPGASSTATLPSSNDAAASEVRDLGNRVDVQEQMFAHGASPFRTASEAPPKIGWTHVWGTVKWGKRAGAWGQGVEGLEERRKEKDREMAEGEGSTGGERKS
ncbi:hypothetical protein M011DRAFT_478808 [Sporormia fimetaria CBS 119925]|uniref:AAA+ ATPase domain-containing protein n=1 Tax=Sporormia fimetaria CBS 119925 TaxID=1340428 RepID=A0A6A6V4U0_9PLEO|nr:hypothetical protein M011DRAFT_478808 [Sporormia fimetaria CBS 119925]